MKRILAIGFVSLSALTLSPTQAQDSAPENDAREEARQSSMGPVCWAAIVEAVSQIGLRCGMEEDPTFRAALDQANSQMGQMFVEQGGWSAEELAAFRSQMGEHDQPAEMLCGNEDAVKLYQHLEHTGSEQVLATTGEMLSRPGQPKWGTCL